MIIPYYCKLFFILLIMTPLWGVAKADDVPKVKEGSACADDILIDDARKNFKRHYDAKRYKKAIENIRITLNKYHALHTCTAKQKREERSRNKLLWAYSDIALASYQLKDMKQCFADITLFHDLIESNENYANNQAFQSYQNNIYQCLDLENVKETIIGYQCEELYQDCLRLKDIMGYRISNKYKNDEKGDSLKLKQFGQKGEIRIETAEGKDQCPTIYWNVNNENKALQIKEEHQHSLSNEDSCCNIEKKNLVLFKDEDKINLQVAYLGQDCTGNNDMWFSEEIYEVNLDENELVFKENNDIWYHE